MSSSFAMSRNVFTPQSPILSLAMVCFKCIKTFFMIKSSRRSLTTFQRPAAPRNSSLPWPLDASGKTNMMLLGYLFLTTEKFQFSFQICISTAYNFLKGTASGLPHCSTQQGRVSGRASVRPGCQKQGSGPAAHRDLRQAPRWRVHWLERDRAHLRSGMRFKEFPIFLKFGSDQYHKCII